MRNRVVATFGLMVWLSALALVTPGSVGASAQPATTERTPFVGEVTLQDIAVSALALATGAVAIDLYTGGAISTPLFGRAIALVGRSACRVLARGVGAVAPAALAPATAAPSVAAPVTVGAAATGLFSLVVSRLGAPADKVAANPAAPALMSMPRQ